MKKILNHLASDWYKYLLELIVITAGVLGAFALNNWNINDANLKREQLVLKSLHKNMLFNIQELTVITENLESVYNASIKLIELTHPGATGNSRNEIDSLIGMAINFATYDPTRGTMDEIINSGQLGLIRNSELRDQLTNWSRLIGDAQKDANIMNNHVFDIFLPYLAKTATLANTPLPHSLSSQSYLKSIPRSDFIGNYEALLTSSEFESLTSLHALNLMYLIREYGKIQAYMEVTQGLIESEIQ